MIILIIFIIVNRINGIIHDNINDTMIRIIRVVVLSNFFKIRKINAAKNAIKNKIYGMIISKPIAILI